MNQILGSLWPFGKKIHHFDLEHRTRLAQWWAWTRKHWGPYESAHMFVKELASGQMFNGYVPANHEIAMEMFEYLKILEEFSGGLNAND